jgi:hypothetical protein
MIENKKEKKKKKRRRRRAAWPVILILSLQRSLGLESNIC